MSAPSDNGNHVERRLAISTEDPAVLRLGIQRLAADWITQLSGYSEIDSPVLIGHGGRFLPLAIRAGDDVVSLVIALESLPAGTRACDELIVPFANSLRLWRDRKTIVAHRTVPFLVPQELGPCLAGIQASMRHGVSLWDEAGIVADDGDHPDVLVAWERASFPSPEPTIEMEGLHFDL